MENPFSKGTVDKRWKLAFCLYYEARPSLKKCRQDTFGWFSCIILRTGSKWAQMLGGSCLLLSDIVQKGTGAGSACMKCCLFVRTPKMNCLYLSCILAGVIFTEIYMDEAFIWAKVFTQFPVHGILPSDVKDVSMSVKQSVLKLSHKFILL